MQIACGYTSIADQQGPWTWWTYGIKINHAWKRSGSKRTFRWSRSKNEYVHPLPSSLLTSYTFWDCANASVMTAGLVSSQFCIYFSNLEPKKVTNDDSDVRSDQKRTWCSTRSRNPRRRARQVGYAVEIGHEDTLRLGLSINTRFICNVYWAKWADREEVKVVKSRKSLIVRDSTYFSLFFRAVRLLGGILGL